jgi:hypothetical protein
MSVMNDCHVGLKVSVVVWWEKNVNVYPNKKTDEQSLLIGQRNVNVFKGMRVVCFVLVVTV